MRKTNHSILILYMFIISSILFSGCSTPKQLGTTLKEDAQKTASMERMRLAIIDFTSKGISRADAEMVNDLLRSKMINTGEFIIVERSQMKEIMREQSLQMSGCTDTACAVKVGRLLSARKILVGTVNKWRRKILITGRIIDVEKGIADFAHDETIEGIDDLDKGISFFVENLKRRIKGQEIVVMEKKREYSPAGKDDTTTMKRDEPREGKNYVWIDLGKEDRGVLLTLAPNDIDGITEPDVKAGVDCKKLPWPFTGKGHNHMCFDIDDSFLWGGNHEVWIVMEYFDSGLAINCQYDSNGVGPVNGAFRGSADGAFRKLRLKNTNTWKFHVWHIKDGRFQNRGNGYDFRFSTHAGGSMWVNRVWVFLYKPPDHFNPDDI
jgi:TolB-like protein